jgi:DNA-binding transcriptional LysR family regulator
MDPSSAGPVTFADFEMFVVFAEYEHFGRTAAALGVSVATVQRGIRALERKLGVELVEQVGRRVRMLHAGNVFVREAHAVLRARLDAVDTMRTESGQSRRVLRVAHTYSMGVSFVPGLLAELLRVHPDLRLHCRQGPATDAVSTLLRGEADVAFMSLSPTEADVVVEPLFTEPLLLAVPVEDPLSGRDRISLGEVRERAFIAMEPGSSSRTHLVNACARAGFVPRITVEGSDLHMVEAMVGAGIGVSVVPGGMGDRPHPLVSRLPIEDARFSGRTVFLAYQRRGSSDSAVQTLIRVARERALLH